MLGVDVDPAVAERLQGSHYVATGDATDPEFGSRTEGELEELDWVLLTMSSHEANMSAVHRLRDQGFTGHLVATSKYPDEAVELREAGADAVFDIFTEAGHGFDSDLDRHFQGYETGVIGLDEILRAGRQDPGKPTGGNAQE